MTGEDRVALVIERLRVIEEELRDLGYDRLREASAGGDSGSLRDEKRILQARRAVERAIHALDAAD